MTRRRGRPITRGRPAASGEPRSWRERYSDLPLWVQALSALVPALLGVLTFLGIGVVRSDGQPSDRLTLDDRSLGSGGIEVSGTYSDLDPDSETIVVMVAIDDPNAEERYSTVEADLTPATGGSGGEDAAQDGTWDARIPVSRTGIYVVHANILDVPHAAGFDSTVQAELREEGPDASVVVESTDPVRIEP